MEVGQTTGKGVKRAGKVRIEHIWQISCQIMVECHTFPHNFKALFLMSKVGQMNGKVE
jgi:hypothetical protein